MANKSTSRKTTAVTTRQIETLIHVVRGQKVMLDTDLASLYEVPASALNQAVRRNKARFPADFLFELTREDAALMQCSPTASRTARISRWPVTRVICNGPSTSGSGNPDEKSMRNYCAISRRWASSTLTSMASSSFRSRTTGRNYSQPRGDLATTAVPVAGILHRDLDNRNEVRYY